MDSQKQVSTWVKDWQEMEPGALAEKIGRLATADQGKVLLALWKLLLEPAQTVLTKQSLLKALAEFKLPEFIPLAEEFLKHESCFGLILEAIRLLAKLESVPAYLAMLRYAALCRDEGICSRVEEEIAALCQRNPLIYYFDALYRHRTLQHPVDKAADYLLEHLSGDFALDIAGALESPDRPLHLQALKYLGRRPSAAALPLLRDYFQKNLPCLRGEWFRWAAEALVATAVITAQKEKVRAQLSALTPRLGDDEQHILSILLTKFDLRRTLPSLIESFPNWSPERKIFFLDSLPAQDFAQYEHYLQELLRQEDRPEVLQKIIDLFVAQKKFGAVVAMLDSESGLRRKLLFRLLLKNPPPGLEKHLLGFVKSDEDDEVLGLVLDFLLGRDADAVFVLVMPIFFSGISDELRVRILRKMRTLSARHAKLFLEAIFAKKSVIASIKKDFIYTLLALLNSGVLTAVDAEWAVNHVLVMLEEADPGELIHFLYFFERYQIKEREQAKLIAEELRLVLNTLLKNATEADLTPRFHLLVRKLQTLAGKG